MNHTTYGCFSDERKASAKNHLFYIREHWEMENKLHWVLDVAFNEDRSTLGVRNATQNMAVS